jgi:4,5-DOPA dioxygenase extradiol
MHELQKRLICAPRFANFRAQPRRTRAQRCRRLTQKLPPPRAIVVVSPHWDTRIPTVSMATNVETIHDFYGFPEELYQLQYPATGCPEVAKEVVQALQLGWL